MVWSLRNSKNNRTHWNNINNHPGYLITYFFSLSSPTSFYGLFWVVQSWNQKRWSMTKHRRNKIPIGQVASHSKSPGRRSRTSRRPARRKLATSGQRGGNNHRETFSTWFRCNHFTKSWFEIAMNTQTKFASFWCYLMFLWHYIFFKWNKQKCQHNSVDNVATSNKPNKTNHYCIDLIPGKVSTARARCTGCAWKCEVPTSDLLASLPHDSRTNLCSKFTSHHWIDFIISKIEWINITTVILYRYTVQFCLITKT